MKEEVKYQLFFSILRTEQRSARFRKNNAYWKNDTITIFFTNIHFLTSFKLILILKTLSIKFV